MKNAQLKFILLLLLSAGTTKSNAQSYASIFSHGEYGTSWIHSWYNLDFGGLSTSRYEKDTLVHGVLYKKVILLTSPNSTFPGGLFREDTVAGKVWYRDIVPFQNPMDTLERLAFQFDLQVGDTVDLSRAGYGPTFPHNTGVVDSIRWINGLKYIYFNQFVQNEPITFIEGIGSNLGIFWKSSIHSGTNILELLYTYLLCSYKNGMKTSYHNLRYDGNCQPDMEVVNPGDKISMGSLTKLYPQPAKGTVKIDHSGKPIIRIQIFTAEGKFLRSMSGENITQWDASNLSAGLYYIKLFSTEGYLTSRRLIVH